MTNKGRNTNPKHDAKRGDALQRAVEKTNAKAKAKGVEPPKSVGGEIYKGRISNARQR